MNDLLAIRVIMLPLGHRDQNVRDHRGRPVRVTLYEEPPGGMMIHPRVDRFRD
jgi:hypothetical protein